MIEPRHYAVVVPISVEDVQSAAEREKRIVDLVRKDMDAGIDAMRRILYEAMYYSERPMFAIFNQPPPWWRRWWRSIREYAVNVGRAVAGQTHDTESEDW